MLFIVFTHQEWNGDNQGEFYFKFILCQDAISFQNIFEPLSVVRSVTLYSNFTFRCVQFVKKSLVIWVYTLVKLYSVFPEVHLFQQTNLQVTVQLSYFALLHYNFRTDFPELQKSTISFNKAARSTFIMQITYFILWWYGK